MMDKVVYGQTLFRIKAEQDSALPLFSGSLPYACLLSVIVYIQDYDNEFQKIGSHFHLYQRFISFGMIS
jgi:hypothetical protein